MVEPFFDVRFVNPLVARLIPAASYPQNSHGSYEACKCGCFFWSVVKQKKRQSVDEEVISLVFLFNEAARC